MKLWETFRYELVYQSRSMSTWFYSLLLLMLSFLMAVVFIDEPLAGGYFSNSPYIITKVSLVTFFFLGLLVLAQFAGNAAVRDLETRMYPLLYSSPIGRHLYLGGRFLAAFVLGSIVMTAIPIGVFVAGLFPLEHPELSGPINAGAYLTTYLLLLLPNTFFVTAFMFAVSVLNRKGMLSYLVATIIAVIVLASWQMLGSQQDNWKLASLADPLGLSIIMEFKKVWSADQKNTLLPGIEIATILNRVLWFGLSGGMLLITYLKFRPSTSSTEKKKVAKHKGSEPAIESHHYNAAQVALPRVSKSFDLSTRLLQICTVARESFRLIVFGWGWMALSCIFLFVVLTGSMWFSDYYEIPEMPVTGHLLGSLENVKEHGIWLVIPLLIIYYAGELVWRERDARLNDIIGSAPVPASVSFIGKFTGLILALVVMQLIVMIAGILLQISLGYYNFQIPVYLEILFGLRLVDYILFAALAFALHIILNQKYLAHLISVLFYLFTMFGPELGIESGLLLYAFDPGWSYSDMRELDPYMKPWFYFKIYWAAWAALLMVVSALLWPRGTENDFRNRLRRATSPGMRVLAGLSLLILAMGGIIYYNTWFLYPETAPVESLEWKAAYEKRYEKYRDNPQPTPTRVKLNVDIYPSEGSADLKGNYVLVNRTVSLIDTLFISTAPEVENHKLSWDRPMKSQDVNEELNFRMYILQEPLLPGDSLQLEFNVTYNPKGFPNIGMHTVVVKNGTWFGDAWLPAIGYQGNREIFNASDRKEQGLEPKSFLEPESESSDEKRIAFEAIIGTDKGQIAVAPGKFMKSWTEGDRSYFHYATEHPINNKLGFFSSDYEVHNAQWISDSGKVVDIFILHDPQHTHNLERMIKGVQASFNYMNSELGTYPHREIRFTEVPGYNKGLFAYPTTILYREGFALLKPAEDPRGIDIVFATVAHEVSHQWWGAQVSPAPIKGAALITESLAWFSAFEIVERSLGNETFAKLIDMARDDYFSPQERAADPLLQASQTSLIYRKGPLALYALREYIGKEQMRLALQTFYKKYSTGDHAKPVPSDLYKELQAVTPDSTRYLLHDLFATNTFWQLKTENVVAAKTASGKWKVTMDVVARKFTVDQQGNETDVEMNDWVQVGVFPDLELTQAPLYLRPLRIRSGEQTIEVEVSQKPHVAGIDPNHLLIDLQRWDNVVDVQF